MILYIVDVTIDGKREHIVRQTVNDLVTALPANHPPAKVRKENRRPTIAELQQLHMAYGKSFVEIVKQALDREARNG
jgi:hypothetical protein